MAAAYTGSFTDTLTVKNQSGFKNNTNISEADDVTSHVKAAEAEIFSSLFGIYSLPLTSNTYYTGSQAKNLLDEVGTKLASGFLLYQQFLGQGGDIGDLAVSKIGEARAILKNIREGKIRLLDSQYAELATVDTGLNTIQGYPNDVDDEDDPSDNENAKFTMDMDF